MQRAEMAKMAGLEIVQPDGDGEITAGYTSDLLSDVMAHAPAGAVLITIQAHKNTVAVAALAGIRAIIICNGRSIPEDMTAAALQEHIALYRTAADQFKTSVAVARLLAEV